MDECIDREAAPKYKADNRPVTDKIIDDIPAADVVPVVRCKDCKHLMFSDCYGECRAGNIGIVRPNDFCSRGKRKDDKNAQNT